MKQKRIDVWTQGVILMILGMGLASCEAIRRSSENLKITIENRKFDMAGSGGRCAKITFHGRNGDLGCEVHELPVEGICPPPGTRGASGEFVPCPPNDSGHADHASDPDPVGTGPAGLTQLPAYRFFGLPLEIDPGESYLEYDLEIRAKNRPQARSIRDAILAQARLGLAGFQERVPGIYVVHHLVQAQLVGSDVLFTLFDTQSFQQLELSVNDMPGYRNLDDAALAQRHGWHMAALAVGLSDLNWGIVPGMQYSNSYHLELAHPGSGSEVLMGDWAFTP